MVLNSSFPLQATPLPRVTQIRRVVQTPPSKHALLAIYFTTQSTSHQEAISTLDPLSLFCSLLSPPSSLLPQRFRLYWPLHTDHIPLEAPCAATSKPSLISIPQSLPKKSAPLPYNSSAKSPASTIPPNPTKLLSMPPLTRSPAPPRACSIPWRLLRPIATAKPRPPKPVLAPPPASADRTPLVLGLVTIALTHSIQTT